MYQWYLSSETKLPLHTSCLAACMWLDRHTLEMDALRQTHNVRAAELSEQVTQLQVKLPFVGLIWAASHVQGGLTAVASASTHSSSSYMPVPEMSFCDIHNVMLCCSMSSVTPFTAFVRGTWNLPSVCQVSLAEAFPQNTLAASQVSLYALQHAICALHCPAHT